MAKFERQNPTTKIHTHTKNDLKKNIYGNDERNKKPTNNNNNSRTYSLVKFAAIKNASIERTIEAMLLRIGIEKKTEPNGNSNILTEREKHTARNETMRRRTLHPHDSFQTDLKIPTLTAQSFFRRFFFHFIYSLHFFLFLQNFHSILRPVVAISIGSVFRRLSSTKRVLYALHLNEREKTTNKQTNSICLHFVIYGFERIKPPMEIERRVAEQFRSREKQHEKICRKYLCHFPSASASAFIHLINVLRLFLSLVAVSLFSLSAVVVVAGRLLQK